jgi:hypothetical protein
MKPDDRCDYDTYDQQYPKGHHALRYRVACSTPHQQQTQCAILTLYAARDRALPSRERSRTQIPATKSEKFNLKFPHSRHAQSVAGVRPTKPLTNNRPSPRSLPFLHPRLRPRRHHIRPRRLLEIRRGDGYDGRRQFRQRQHRDPFWFNASHMDDR